MNPPDNPEPSTGPEPIRHYAWPKYVLTAVALFFTVCFIWTVKEVSRLRRAKADGLSDMGTPSQSIDRTNNAR
jgi:hypothetical protein